MIKQAQEYKKQCELLTKQETEMKSQVTNTKREVPTGYIAFVIYFQEHYKLTIWGGELKTLIIYFLLPIKTL